MSTSRQSVPARRLYASTYSELGSAHWSPEQRHSRGRTRTSPTGWTIAWAMRLLNPTVVMNSCLGKTRRQWKSGKHYQIRQKSPRKTMKRMMMSLMSRPKQLLHPRRHRRRRSRQRACRWSRCSSARRRISRTGTAWGGSWGRASSGPRTCACARRRGGSTRASPLRSGSWSRTRTWRPCGARSRSCTTWRATPTSLHRGRLRGRRGGARRHGALRRRRALRPHREAGPLHGEPGGRAGPGHRRRRGVVPLPGRHAPRPQARELPLRGQRGRRAAQDHRLRHLHVLPARSVRSSLAPFIQFINCYVRTGDKFTDVVGTPYYMAPEVLEKKYGQEADVWSAGVIIYILLCGVPPFWAEMEEDIFDQVLHGSLDFEFDPWPDVSHNAKDLLRRVLVRDPEKRLTAHQVLRHPWFQMIASAPDKPLDSAVLSRLKQFSEMNKLKKMAVRVIAENLLDEEIAGLKELFKMMDTDKTGQINFEELKAGLRRVGANMKEPEIHQLMQAADIDNSGTIDYGEFIAATLHLNKVERDDNLFAAFQYFDKDGSGYITADKLHQACHEFGIEDVQLEDMRGEVDQDNDGRIDYNEFVAMMQKSTTGFRKKGH